MRFLFCYAWDLSDFKDPEFKYVFVVTAYHIFLPNFQVHLIFLIVLPQD